MTAVLTEQLDRAMRALILSVPEVVAAVGQNVYRDVRPDSLLAGGQLAGACVVYTQWPSSNVRVVGGDRRTRVAANPRFDVKWIVPAASITAAELAIDALDVALENAGWGQETPISYPEVLAGGIKVRHIGGEYTQLVQTDSLP